jgi:hypothetical protein
MPSINGQFVVPGVFSQVQANLLPTAPGGIRIPALIGTGKNTNTASGEAVTRGVTAPPATDALAHTATAIDGNITDENFVIYINGVDFSLNGGGVGWLSNAAQITGTTLSSSYTSSLVGQTFILSIANGTLHTYVFALADFKDANDTTASVPFAITSVTDGTHLVVSSTAGMTGGDTITQGVASTTITTVVDGTHLTVGSTVGFVSSYNVTNVVAALNADFLANSINAVASNSASHLKVATTVTSDSSLYIGAGTANSALGFTSGSFVQTPQAPLAGVIYYVTYEYAKVTADYTPKFYFTLQSVVNDYGAVSSSTSISNGASLVFQNGASIVCVCQENPADGSPISQVQSALNKLLATQNISIVVSLEGTHNAQLLPAIKQHVDIASSTINKLERTAIVGLEGVFTDQDMLGFASSVGDNRIVLLNASETTNKMFIGSDQTESVVGGQYVAAALAGVRCNPAFDVAQPMTREVLSGFSSITNTLTQAEKSLLINQGVCVIDTIQSVPKVLFGTTTDFSTIANQLYQVTQIMDFVAQSLRGLLDPIFIGQKLLAATPSQIQTVTSAILTTIQADNIIVAFTTPSAIVDSVVPTQINLTVGVQPTLEVDVIFITLGLNLQ